MNYNDIICYDYETTSANPLRTQPVQLAAVIIDGRRLVIKSGSEFSSLIKPEFDLQKCEELGLDPLQDGAIKVHGLSTDKLENAPSLQSVWSNFTDYVKQYNPKGNNWGAPVPCGRNIANFDNIITHRICTQKPWGFGPSDKDGRQSLFHQIYAIDTMNVSWLFHENDKNVHSLSGDNLIRGYMGYSKGKAHEAFSDVMMEAEYIIRILKWVRTKNIAFAGCFNDSNNV